MYCFKLWKYSDIDCLKLGSPRKQAQRQEFRVSSLFEKRVQETLVGECGSKQRREKANIGTFMSSIGNLAQSCLRPLRDSRKQTSTLYPTGGEEIGLFCPHSQLSVTS